MPGLEPTRLAALLGRWWKSLLAVCLLATGAYVFLAPSGEAQPGAGQQGRPAGARDVPVVAAAAATGDIGVYLTGLGAVTPLATVTVRTRVDGQLMTVLFQEGQLVRSGDLLAQIDP